MKDKFKKADGSVDSKFSKGPRVSFRKVAPDTCLRSLVWQDVPGTTININIA